MIQGNVSKMRVSATEPAEYYLLLSEHEISLAPYLNRRITLTYSGTINCTHCGRKTKKSYSQGYCFPCTQKLAECDLCIMRPETCHFHLGTCRDPEWAEGHCMQPHVVYLANSSGIKVGITRGTQIPTRWLDQGATQALPIFTAKTRRQVGLLEHALKQHISDRTDWRKMLKSEAEAVDLTLERDKLFDLAADELEKIEAEYSQDIARVFDQDITNLSYPVNQYPTKVSSLNFDKTPEISGVLQGIKGQYLILDKGVLNMRKFTGYELTFSGEEA